MLYFSIDPINAKSCGFQKVAQYTLTLRPWFVLGVPFGLDILVGRLLFIYCETK